MATFNLLITYPDAQQTRILNALKANWTTQVDGAPVVPTTPQVIEKLRQVVLANIRDIVLTQERNAAVAAAVASVVPVDPT